MEPDDTNRSREGAKQERKWTAGLKLYVGGTKAGPTVRDGCILKVERRTEGSHWC
jgi:hypothetical protein